VQSGASNDDAHAEDGFVADTLQWIVRVRDAAAGVEHVLEVWLNLPPACDLDLIGDLDEGLAATDRDETSREESGVAAEAGRGRADLGDAKADAGSVVVAARQRRLQGDTSVDTEV
jgi:hypothetical protein